MVNKFVILVVIFVSFFGVLAYYALRVIQNNRKSKRE